MTDFFAVFGEQRRPWLEAEVLKQKFLALSAEAHPDRAHTAGAQERQQAQDRYTSLNAAYQVLREPKERLRHLIELERGTKPGQIQRIPSDLMNLSLEVGEICRQADALVQEKAKTSSPLLQVQVFERAQAATEKLGAVQRSLEPRREEILEQIRALDATWDEAGDPGRSTSLARLEELYPLLTYYERWIAQARERIVQLAF